MHRLLIVANAVAIWLAFSQDIQGGPAATSAVSKPSTAASQAGKFTISRETTFIDGPLNDDGTINYVKAINDIYSKGVTLENNAVVLLFKAFGPEFASENIRKQVLKELGLADLPEKGDYFQGPLNDKEFQDQLSRATTRPANQETEPLVLKCLKDNQESLEELVSASKKEMYFVPLFSKYTPPMMLDASFGLNSRRIRTAFKILTARALIRAEEGNFQDAQNDLMAVHRTARLFWQGSSMIEQLVGISLDALAYKSEQNLAASGKLSSEQSKAIMKQIQSLSTFSSLDKTVNYNERFSELDIAMMYIRRGVEGVLNASNNPATIQGEVASMPEKVTLHKFELDYDEYMRVINQDINEVLQYASLKTYAERKAAFDKIGSHPIFVGNWMPGKACLTLRAKYSVSWKPYALRLMTLILLLTPSRRLVPMGYSQWFRMPYSKNRSRPTNRRICG